jgi:hypothetical protein
MFFSVIDEVTPGVGIAKGQDENDGDTKLGASAASKPCGNFGAAAAIR